MKRRHFFKSISGIAGGLLLTTSGKATAQNFVDDGSWQSLRKEFLIPTDYAYFNTAGLGSSPRIVREQINAKMDEENRHPVSSHSTEEWLAIKEKCAGLLGPGIKKEEIAFTSTTTEGINIILNGLPLKEGDEIITSTHEHVALNIPLLYIAKRKGIKIRTFQPNLEENCGNVSRIKAAISNKTRLIFISHVTCSTGQVLPLQEIGQLAKSKGIWLAVDGAQAIGNIPLNIKQMGIDFYAVSGHKWLLGPKRTGLLYVPETHLDLLQPSTVGAYSDVGFNFDTRSLTFHPTARRYEYGTQNDALFYGLEAAVDFVNRLGMKNIYKHNTHLAGIFYNKLQAINKRGIKVLSPQEESARSGIVTFRLTSGNNAKISYFLGHQGFRVRHVYEGNLDGIRASFHIYNNLKEVDKFLAQLKTLIAK
jgi:cysteine desulfurase / selenocysteine lyase